MIDKKELKELHTKSTKTVAWYPHGTGDSYHPGKASVRGPFFRWIIVTGFFFRRFIFSEVDERYRGYVATLEDDAKYCAAAMNAVPELLAEIDRLESKITKITDTVQDFFEGDNIENYHQLYDRIEDIKK